MADQNVARHYDKLAGLDDKEARALRAQSKTLALRGFHNEVKRQLINGFSYRAPAHLDIACGRGGDVWKWAEAQIRHVHGMDISPSSIEECKARQRKVEQKYRRPFEYQFEARSDLGTAVIQWPQLYNTVGCMFAAHYLFATESSAKLMIQNAANALQPGGYFYGTIVCGKRVVTLLATQPEYRSHLLSIKRMWEPAENYQLFGSGYTFAIADTVTDENSTSEDVEVGEGCQEYLVFFSAFTSIAAKYGLEPDESAWSRVRPSHRSKFKDQPVLEPGPADGRHVGFRHFLPPYEGEDAEEMAKISRLYAAFCFKKVEPRRAKQQASKQGQEEEPRR